MDRENILACLREHSAEIKDAGVSHLRLFGSAARNEMRPDSDIDLLVEFDEKARVTLLTLAGLQQQLTKLLGVEVDISSLKWMHEAVRREALKDVHLAF